MSDQVEQLFPGCGHEIPSDEERDRADALVGFEIPRIHPQYGVGPVCKITNRAFMRSRIKRWCAKTGREW